MHYSQRMLKRARKRKRKRKRKRERKRARTGKSEEQGGRRGRKEEQGGRGDRQRWPGPRWWCCLMCETKKQRESRNLNTGPLTVDLMARGANPWCLM